MKDTAHNFPIKLHTLLDSEDPDIVCWTLTGNGFRINDMDRFRDEALPKYWRHTKMTSFQRQLNLYGFKKINHGDDIGAYYHPLFVRGKRELLKDIKRSAIKSSAMEAELNCINRIVDRSRAEPDCTQEVVCLKDSLRKRAVECDDVSDCGELIMPSTKRPLYAQADTFYANCATPLLHNWEPVCDPAVANPPFLKTEQMTIIPKWDSFPISDVGNYNGVPDPWKLTPLCNISAESKFDFDFFFENFHRDLFAIPDDNPSPEFIATEDVISDEEFMLLMGC